MAVLLMIAFFVLAPVCAWESCLTPDGKSGECVVINQCPRFFVPLLGNKTKSVSKDHISQSYCGLESILIPKVCCPIEDISRPASRCGIHTPEGEQDPWIVLIGYEEPDGKRRFLCGGVLIHKRYILTAAHCVKNISQNQNTKLYPFRLTVRFGNYNAHPPLDIEVDNVVVHENYNHEKRHNDIALVRLKKKVSLKHGEIQPICLPLEVGKIIEGTYQLAGWEKTENDFIKRAGVAIVWKQSECYSWYNSTEVRLEESQICVEGKKRPYLHKHGINVGGILMDISQDNSYSIIGIASLKPSCCENEDHPKIYTKVAKYINWIISNLDS